MHIFLLSWIVVFKTYTFPVPNRTKDFDVIEEQWIIEALEKGAHRQISWSRLNLWWDLFSKICACFNEINLCFHVMSDANCIYIQFTHCFAFLSFYFLLLAISLPEMESSTKENCAVNIYIYELIFISFVSRSHFTQFVYTLKYIYLFISSPWLLHNPHSWPVSVLFRSKIASCRYFGMETLHSLNSLRSVTEQKLMTDKKAVEISRRSILCQLQINNNRHINEVNL